MDYVRIRIKRENIDKLRSYKKLEGFTRYDALITHLLDRLHTTEKILNLRSEDDIKKFKTLLFAVENGLPIYVGNKLVKDFTTLSLDELDEPSIVFRKSEG